MPDNRRTFPFAKEQTPTAWTWRRAWTGARRGNEPSAFGDIPFEFVEEDRSTTLDGELDSYRKKPAGTSGISMVQKNSLGLRWAVVDGRGIIEER